MSDLISREALIEGIACHKQYTDQKYETDRQWAIGYNAGIERALFSIAYAKAVDAEPVRHATLEETGTDELWCSWGDCTNCGYSNPMGVKFCNGCGAMMGGKQDAE